MNYNSCPWLPNIGSLATLLYPQKCEGCNLTKAPLSTPSGPGLHTHVLLCGFSLGTPLSMRVPVGRTPVEDLAMAAAQRGPYQHHGWWDFACRSLPQRGPR